MKNVFELTLLNNGWCCNICEACEMSNKRENTDITCTVCLNITPQKKVQYATVVLSQGQQTRNAQSRMQKLHNTHKCNCNVFKVII